MGGCTSSRRTHDSEKLALPTAQVASARHVKENEKSTDEPPIYKKNQVVPLLPQAPGEYSKLTAVGFSSNSCSAGEQATSKQGKGLKGSNSTVKQLLEACAAACTSSSKVKQLTFMFQKVVDSMPAFLGQATVKTFPDTLVRTCVMAATQFADQTMLPIVSTMERTFSHHEAGTASTPVHEGAWDSLTFPQLLDALKAACKAQYAAAVTDVGQLVGLVLELVYHLHKHAQEQSMALEPALFMVPSVNQLASMLSIVLFHRVVLESSESLQTKQEQVKTLCSTLGWASTSQLAIGMSPSARAAFAALSQSASAGAEQRANFVVRRSSAFWDAFAQAQEQGVPLSSSAARPFKVFPSFVDEVAGSKGSGKKPVVEAGEGHGPRKEFFLLAGASMCGLQQQQQQQAAQRADSQAPKPLFTFNRSAGAFWYNATLQQSPALQAAYRFAGWLVGQSLNNKAPLGIRLPAVLLQQQLLGLSKVQHTLSDLEAFDPDAAANIQKVAALPPGQLRDMMEVEGLPASTTAEQYIRHAVRQVLLDDVKWQAQAFGEGLASALQVSLLQSWCLGGAELAEVVAGEAGGAGSSVDIDVPKLFRVVMDPELGGKEGVLGELLWEVLASWTPERQRLFLQFVTGSQRPPLPGSELLKVESPFIAFGLQQHKAQLGMLPQAHTCDNLLELPNYWASLLQVSGFKSAAAVPPEKVQELRQECFRILDDRLTLAVTCFSGYGLDERDGGSSGGDAGDDVVDVVEDTPGAARKQGDVTRQQQQQQPGGKSVRLGVADRSGIMAGGAIHHHVPLDSMLSQQAEAQLQRQQQDLSSVVVLEPGVAGPGSVSGPESGSGQGLKIKQMQPFNITVDLAGSKDATILSLSTSLDPFSPLADVSGFRGLNGWNGGGAAQSAHPVRQHAGGGKGGLPAAGHQQMGDTAELEELMGQIAHM